MQINTTKSNFAVPLGYTNQIAVELTVYNID